MKNKKICLLLVIIFLLSSVVNANKLNVENSDSSFTLKNNSDSFYNMVIITDENLKNSNEYYNLQKLKEVHEDIEQGFKVKIKTIDEIETNPDFWADGKWGDGNESNPFIIEHVASNLTLFNDTPAKIRNFIRYAYYEKELEYVLIVGDDDIVPARRLFILDSSLDKRIPSDFYYACLDGTYNDYEDYQWGDPSWDIDPGFGCYVDFIQEVSIGRACVGNENELTNFVKKTIWYMETAPSKEFLRDVLFVGQHLDLQADEWGGNFLDDFIDTCDDEGYTTKGFPSDEYYIEKLYERDQGLWSAKKLCDEINKNNHFIVHDGHATWDKNMKITEGNIDQIHNNGRSFIFSVGCHAGKFDESDCMAEYFTVKNEHCAFAGVWNTGRGFYSSPGNRLNREFWDAIFGEGISRIGDVVRDCKEDLYFYLDAPDDPGFYIMEMLYGMSLFGDPAVSLIKPTSNRPPDRPEISGRKTGEYGVEYTYTANATDPDGDTIEYYLFDWGDGVSTGWQINSSASHAWNTKGNFDVKVKAKDEHGLESEWGKLQVSMPKIKIYNRLNQFFDNHPFLLYVFQYFLKMCC